jgi:hydrogenase maturation protein HypF
MKERKKINIKGIVQGVGFRPFIYSLAKKHSLKGFVCNDTEGVVIDVEGDKHSINKFIKGIEEELPILSIIDEMKVKNLPINNYKTFTIKSSSQNGKRSVLISPDTATCQDCIRELFDKNDHHYRYPFINCTNCGPRFTIIKDIPYDRERTTMKKFKMCKLCQTEYDDPQDRRFHAQPNGCPDCGPEVILHKEENKNSKQFCPEQPIKETARLLKDGKIIAIKGLGGFHLACDAQNKEAVYNLRSNKYREEKPFAMMAKNMDTIESFCKVNDTEKALLLSQRAPILLLERGGKNSIQISEMVAPKQKYYGVMLPYAPLHHLLFAEDCPPVLVMTSGNVSEEPICYRYQEAKSRLSGIADYFLTHNRDIHIRCDDSVTRVFNEKEMLVRRSRGYVPEPITLPFTSQKHVLACGGELKNTFCLTRENKAFLSHHIGDLENLETLTSFEKGIEHFKKLFTIQPQIIAYDIHPEYLSTKYARKLAGKNPKLETFGIQHHHAHIVSCMVENGIAEKVIGVALDGAGYGTDGTIWGGEFLLADMENFKRMAHLQNIPMPGGTMAIKEPWRMAASYLYSIYGNKFLDLGVPFTKELDRDKWKIMRKMLDAKINSPLTSSMGRLFDVVSALLKIRKTINYEGQAAIELEMAIEQIEERREKREEDRYKYLTFNKNEMLIIDAGKIVEGIVRDIKKGSSIPQISLKFHNTISRMIVDTTKNISKKTGVEKIVLSGGVFQNMFLLEHTVNELKDSGFQVYTHHKVPTNDGGISLGQAAIAIKKSQRG